jgi:hypothetical protein
MKIRRKIIVFSFMVLCFAVIGKAQEKINIIPKPVLVEEKGGSSFTFTNNTKIIANSKSEEYEVAEYLDSLFMKCFADFRPVYNKVQ